MSAGCFDNASCLLSSYKNMNEDHSLTNPLLKQGIVSILSSDFNNNNTIIKPSSPQNSIRRTLSAADMSSQRWLQSNGFPQLSSLKRVRSSLQVQVLGEEGDIHRHQNNILNNDLDDNKGQGQAFEDVWSSIQADKKSWSSILSSSKIDGSGSGSGQLPPPYVHPLTKRSSSLSEKSLEICTESLGSETGSDGFSFPPSEPEDSDRVQEQEQQAQEQEQEQEPEIQEAEMKCYANAEVDNYKYANSKGPTIKRSMMVPPARPSFPPPLPSLAHRDDGSNLHIRSHRQDGRLVVEAVSVPSLNCFRAQRQDGRLLLTLSSDGQEQEEEKKDQDGMFDDDGAAMDEDNVENEEDNHEVEEEEEEEEEGEYGARELAIPRGMVNVQRSCTTLTMSKLMELTSTRNKSTWPRNYNTTVIKTLNDDEEEIDDDEGQETTTVTQKLSPQPRMRTASAAAVVLNAYEYYWRQSDSPAATAVAMLNPLARQQNNSICAPQVGKDTKRNNKLLFAAHNRKGVALAQQEVVLVKAAGRGGGVSIREKAEYLVPLMLRGCKEPKRSLLFWEPYCIATS